MTGIESLESQIVKVEDARGLNCPMPILRTKKALASVEGGQLIKVLTTDKAAVGDLQLFAKQTHHEICAQLEVDSGVTAHYVRKRPNT